MTLSSPGDLTLINATPFEWSRTYTHSYQMTAWDFPEKVKSGEIISVPVDWSILGNRNDAAGEASYLFTTDEGTVDEFQFQASFDGRERFHVLYENTSTFGNPPGADIDLEWDSGAGNPFIFSGKRKASFESTNP
jgi:hypothetical protein